MAKLGTVFVELSLDDKVYKQKLSETLTSTQATAKGIEKSWQVLGQKSDETFNAQRRSYENALTLIKNSHNATQQDILRAERATAEKLKSLHQEQFGHQVGIIEGLKKNWLAATAVITTAIIGINKAWDLAKIGAEYAEQRGILDNLANKYRTTADEIVKQMQRASDGLVAKSDLMQVALEGIAKGLKPDQMVELANAAKLLGDTVGQSATESLKGLSEALETGRMKALKGYTGSTIDLKDAFGELADKLTAAEKAQAMYDLIIQHSTELQNQQNKAVDDAADKIERMEASYNNAKLAAGNFFKTIIAGIYDMTIALASAPHIDVSGMSGVDDYVAKAKATGQGNMIVGGGDMDAASLAALDMHLLKKNAAARVTGKSGSGESAAAKQLKEEQRILELQRDLWIKDEAAKWEALEKYYEEQEKLEKEHLEALHREADERAKVFEKQQQGAENYRQIMAQLNIDIAEGHEKAIMQIMEDDRRMYDNITKLMDDGVISFDEAMQAWEKLAEKTGKSIKDIIQDDLTEATKKFQEQLRSVSDSFGMLSNACMDLASIYDEGSESARRWQEAAKAMEIAQRAVAVVQAVVAIATQGLGDPYTAFARIAAMTAAMASLLATIGESVGGGGGGSSSHLPVSTVLGAEAGTKSESISNSFELLRDIYDIENTKLTNIYNELRDLNNNITGLVTSIVRTGGVSAASMNISTGTTAGSFEKMAKLPIAQNMGFLSSIGNFLNQPILDIGNWLFGGKVKTKVTASGIAFDDQSIADVLSGGMDAMQYADIKTTKSGWFGSKKTSKSTKYGELDSEVSAMFDKVFQGMGQSLVYFAQNLGTSVNDVLNYTFEKTKLDLKDMTAEEMNEAISGYISSASDNAVSALFGDIVGKYQELNEGLMETATRLIVDKEIVASVLEDTGKAFKGTVPEMIAFSEQLIDIAGGLDQLTEAAQSYIDKFYTDAEKFASTKQSIRDVAGILPRTREDYRRLVESIDLTSEVGKQAYYTLLALSDTADSYYSHIEDIANQRAEMEIELLNAQGKTAEALAASRKRELEAMDESLRPLQELIWLTQDLGTQLETVTTSVTTEINALISNSSSAASQARSMANTYKNLIETLEEAQIKIFGGGKAGAQIRLNDIYGKAMTGDADALGKMPAAIDTLLSESLASARTSLEYRRDQAKSYIALGQAAKVSENMMNWEEYQATLLETQTKVLELIRDDIQSNNYAELQKHSELLGNIGTLLETSNAVTLTGNATQDVIKNLDAINTSYTAEMLTELVSGGTSQTNSLLSILSSSQTVVTLLGQLLSVFQANEQAIAQKEIEMSKAEYNAALSETSAALASLQAARAATASANEVANIEASQYMQANYMAGVASNYYAQNPTAANKSDMDKYMAIADTEYSQYAAAQANLNTATAQEKAALDIYNQSLSTVAQLKQVTNALIDVYNAQYPSAPIQKFAEGGTFGGGWRVVGEKGWELEYTGPSTIVNNKEAKKLLDNTELISEVRKLNASLEKYGYYIAKYTQKSSNVLDKFDRDGLPEERAA